MRCLWMLLTLFRTVATPAILDSRIIINCLRQSLYRKSNKNLQVAWPWGLCPQRLQPAYSHKSRGRYSPSSRKPRGRYSQVRYHRSWVKVQALCCLNLCTFRPQCSVHNVNFTVQFWTHSLGRCGHRAACAGFGPITRTQANIMFARGDQLLRRFWTQLVTLDSSLRCLCRALVGFYKGFFNRKRVRRKKVYMKYFTFWSYLYCILCICSVVSIASNLFKIISIIYIHYFTSSTVYVSKLLLFIKLSSQRWFNDILVNFIYSWTYYYKYLDNFVI